MHFVTFSTKGHTARPGLWFQKQQCVLDIKAAERHYLNSDALPCSLLGIIQQQDNTLPLLRSLHAVALADVDAACRIPLHQARLLAPYATPPRNILCIGINYRDHLKELDRPLLAEQKLPQTPIVFSKPCTCIADPDTAVDSHVEETQMYDYEGELAVIIGKSGKNIRKEDALEHVFGYAVLNDMSARDLQRATTQWYRGKCLDESAPFGPCIACRESIPDPQNLAITSRINGEIRQQSHTSHMIFDVATLISTVSIGSTLQAGDIISTGTPAGVGMSFTPPRFLKSGDIMEMEIEGIGVLRNSIR